MPDLKKRKEKNCIEPFQKIHKYEKDTKPQIRITITN